MTTDTPTAPASTPREKVTGRRIVAGLIDGLLLGAVFVGLAAATGNAEAEDGTFSVSLTGGPFLLYLLLFFGYYILLESRSGKTVGKAVMGLRVVSEATGAPPSTGQAVGRTLLRIVDALPVLYLVGLVCVAVTRKDQRVGDMAANTLVVRA
jgi:uncharacterized RDD family membrane protein YckC